MSVAVFTKRVATHQTKTNNHRNYYRFNLNDLKKFTFLGLIKITLNYTISYLVCRHKKKV